MSQRGNRCVVVACVLLLVLVVIADKAVPSVCVARAARFFIGARCSLKESLIFLKESLIFLKRERDAL